MFTGMDTSIATPQLLRAPTSLDLRPILCEPKFVHVDVMHASMGSSVYIVSRQAGRLLDTGFSTYLYNCTSIRRVCCARPSIDRRQ
jgi:hypothetical protein